MDKQHIAILVFIRSAAEEAERKPLGYSKKQSQKIAQLLNQRTIREARKTNFPTYIIDESLQKGDDFGSRLDYAWRYVFDQGYEQVIAIGNDCLEVTCNQLEKAASQLDQKKAVVGPTQDGGFYLLGLHKTVFERLDFINLPWQTTDLYLSLLKQLDTQIQEVEILDLAIDIDHQSTLEAVLKQVPNRIRIKHYILNLLSLSQVQFWDQPIKNQVSLSFTNQRGPPLIFAH